MSLDILNACNQLISAWKIRLTVQYVKIKDVIVEQIESGMLSPNQKLPSERKLAESFDTTRVTLREALSLLEAEGRIYREDRRGWFISTAPLKYDPAQSLGFSDLARTHGREAQTEIISAKTILADKQAATLLKLQPFSDVYRIDRVRYLDGRPVVYVTSYLLPERFSTLLSFDLSQSLTSIITEHFGIQFHKMHYRVSTRSLLGPTAAALRATTGTPAMVIERVNYDRNGEVIGCTIEQWRHDSVNIESTVELLMSSS